VQERQANLIGLAITILTEVVNVFFVYARLYMHVF
jgi:hypothetical protein